MAASATFALKAGVWFRRARLLIVSPDSRVNLARRQAETPLIPLFRFLRPALPSTAAAVAGKASACPELENSQDQNGHRSGLRKFIWLHIQKPKGRLLDGHL